MNVEPDSRDLFVFARFTAPGGREHRLRGADR